MTHGLTGWRRRSTGGSARDEAAVESCRRRTGCRRRPPAGGRHRRVRGVGPAGRRDRDARARQLHRGVPVRSGGAGRGHAALPAARVADQPGAGAAAAGRVRRHRHPAAVPGGVPARPGQEARDRASSSAAPRWRSRRGVVVQYRQAQRARREEPCCGATACSCRAQDVGGTGARTRAPLGRATAGCRCTTGANSTRSCESCGF